MTRTIILSALLFAGSPLAAYAHAFLESAAPPVGSTVQQRPAEVELTFTEGVEPLFSTIAVQDAAGRHVETGQPHRAGDSRHLAIALQTLAPGAYQVTWHAVSVDTHKTQGRYTFTVAP